MQRALKSSLVFMLCALPLGAGAHATPVEYVPDASAQLSEMPAEISVRFSERVDANASFLRVEGPDGIVSEKAAVGEDPRSLTALVEGREGEYLVKWGVVSLDDGHFTRGEYSFAVGAALADTIVPSFQHVTLTTRAEAVAMTFELFGNGMLWALLALFAVGLRPLLPSLVSEKPLLLRSYLIFGWCGIGLALAGQILQLLIKASDLAALQEVAFQDAFLSYLQTAAGGATVWRFAAIACFAAIFYWSAKKIFSSTRFTAYEFLLAASLCVFAYFRAVISHATANPFYPEFSIAVNFLHLIEKDIWAGIALALALMALSPRLQRALAALLPAASRMLAMTFALLAATGGYIIWLHLESFRNLLTTGWGEAFVPLAVSALVLVAARLYGTFIGTTPLTLAAEATLALLVVYRSSVVILTSPPLHTERHLDPFGIAMLALVAAAAVIAAALYRAAGRAAYAPRSYVAGFAGAAGAAAAVAAILFILPFLGIHNAFKKECLAHGNMWHFMPPSMAGVPVSDASQEGCMWGMGAYLYHFSERAEYEQHRSLGEADVSFERNGNELTFALTNSEGEPAELFVDMEKRLHIIITSRDQSVFAHIHPDAEPEPSVFTARYAFPKSGEYLISVDYAHGIRQYSKQFSATVSNAGPAQGETRLYQARGEFGGYSAEVSYGYLQAGEVATLLYDITKDGKPAVLQPYLSAAMHISAVKHDLSAFVHAHGEVHDPDAPQPPILVVDGRVAHSHLPVPPSFSSPIDAHLIFPSPGMYTVWSEFSAGGAVIPASFTVRVE